MTMTLELTQKATNIIARLLSYSLINPERNDRTYLEVYQGDFSSLFNYEIDALDWLSEQRKAHPELSMLLSVAVVLDAYEAK